jgi:hypothetical protein
MKECKMDEQTVYIHLDARIHSDLNWSDAKEKAEESIAKGMSLIWDINFGLFSSLKHPLDDTAQFSTFDLAVEHFMETLWKPFAEHSKGVLIYRGKLDWEAQFPWDLCPKSINELDVEQGSLPSQLLCRDVMTDYLSQLAGSFDYEVPIFVSMDATNDYTLMEEALLLHPECFEVLQLSVHGGQHQHGPSEANYGVLLPYADLYQEENFPRFEEAFQYLKEQEIPYRLVSEMLLTSSWDGLDYLFVHPESLSDQGIRKLQGFCAAGGTVINLAETMHLALEESFTKLRFVSEVSVL